MVRGRGYIQNVGDIEQVSLGAKPDGTPILVKDVGRVHLGPEMRRGVAELNGEGDVAGGIVVIRYGVDTYGVIENVKKAVKETHSAGAAAGRGVRDDLRPLGVSSSARSTTLKEKLIEEGIIVSLVCVVFLWHFRSALVAILTLPLSILLSFVAMRFIGLGSNIMSLGGIAIAIGAMIDAAIIMIENAHKHLEHDGRSEAAPRDPDRSGAGGGPSALLLSPDHHRVVPAHLHARRAGGTPLQAAGVHEDVRDGLRGADVRARRPLPDGALHPRPHPKGRARTR